MIKTMLNLWLTLFLVACDGLSSSGISIRTNLDVSDQCRPKFEQALEKYKPKMLSSIIETNGTHDAYCDGAAFVQCQQDVDWLASNIAHEDFHAMDNSRPEEGESIRKFKQRREFNANKYQIQLLKSLGRNDLVGRVPISF